MTLKMKRKKSNPIFISLLTNFLLMLGKGIIGILANSNALVADAAHSMTDVTFFLINYKACKDCQLYKRIDKKGNERTRQRIEETEIRATYITGIILLTIGMAICFHNFMILVLDKAQKPDSITILAAFVSLGTYAWLYKYLEKNEGKIEDCFITEKNTNWQNKVNLVSGLVVVIGLIATMFGFVFMDEFAAIVVGSIVLSMGVKLFIEAVEHPVLINKYNSTIVVLGCLVTAIILTMISLSIQI